MVLIEILRSGFDLHYDQWDQIGLFITFGGNFQSLWQQLFSQIAHILGNFCKGVKIFHFSSEIIFV